METTKSLPSSTYVSEGNDQVSAVPGPVAVIKDEVYFIRVFHQSVSSVILTDHFIGLHHHTQQHYWPPFGISRHFKAHHIDLNVYLMVWKEKRRKL